MQTGSINNWFFTLAVVVQKDGLCHIDNNFDNIYSMQPVMLGSFIN